VLKAPKAHRPTIEQLAPEFDLTLLAQNRAPTTRYVYGAAIDRFVRFLRARDLPTTLDEVGRDELEAFFAHLVETKSASTAKTRYGGLQRFFNWAVEEDELEASPMERMRPPLVPTQPVPGAA
jgi:site-specific recombinase XerD